ncbi:family 78 glycoside hydrolase catalytic domain [Chitinophaga silvisoli]|uniref:alpha-L-rhamnosidase n=1 Tax=Chitinophaga silvisoli TaxID=2291814 RepID=A0A3E1NSP3_9BACT|nr:family 78 glycoside hydrolase catalytic domain [Chitinophaga silvisoli]RFM30969.1 alpha-L-rhamnosidase [Chitinophaga silvisoli]
MINRLSLLFITQLLCVQLYAQVKVDQLLTENLNNPESVENTTPRFSWKLITTQANTTQTAYELTVMSGNKSLWNSGKVNSDQSIFVPYGGSTLQSGDKYSWKVRIWDNKQKASAWSTPAYFRLALTKADWKAKWIEPGYEEDSVLRPSPIFKTTFKAGKKIASGIAYITCHGVYEGTINGKRIGEAYLTPGFTDYVKRLQYQAYDVTNLLQNGDNNIELTLGSGWFRGIVGWWNQNNHYGKTLALLYQMQVTYTDGTKETLISDENWQCSTGKIAYAEIYNGETIDNRKSSTTWYPVKVVNYSMDNLVPTTSELVTKHETFKPLAVITTPKGETVIDFGQNLSGFVHFKASGKAGDSIILEHGEVLDKAGNFYNANLRTAAAKDVFILNGKGEEYFEPHFTYHGFRYVRVKGSVKPEQMEAVALYSDCPLTGTFECSNPMINQLQHNILWSQNDNFVDIPTDCPQRDERLGWTGDAQTFSKTAAFNRNVNNFFAKWLKDLAADQLPNGAVPFVVPNLMGDAAAAAGWADAATVIPWTIYQAYGDKKMLSDQYPSMKAWVEFIKSRTHNDLWDNGFQFGDWLSYRADGLTENTANTDSYLVAQCYYAYSTQLMINAAKTLGKQEDVEKYSALLKRIKEAFFTEYVTPKGRIMSNTQTAYVLALQFDLLPENLRPIAAKNLAANIASYKYHLTTGFLGTYFLTNVLSNHGYIDVAYKLLLQDTYPSWLYPVKMGATTIWERWDGMRPDSTFQTTDMNSFNHYSYGAIGEWMYRVVAGIDMDPSVPGYKKIRIKPQPGGDLTYAKASLETGYGKVGVDWKIKDGKFTMDVEIPANTTAEIFVPATDGYEQKNVGSGKYHYESVGTTLINKGLTVKENK